MRASDRNGVPVQKNPLTLIQLTDSHLFGDSSKELMGIHTCQSFRDVIKLVQAQEEDVDQILVTGDISQDDSPESYRFCQETLDSFKAPSAWLCGNHDEAKELTSGKFSSYFLKRVDLGNWIILLMNTQVSGKTYGELSPQELDTMEEILQRNPDKPVLLAMHHHPLPIDSPWMDEIPMSNGKDLMTRLQKYPQVKVILHGHIHQERETVVNGVHILATPSTSVQFAPGATDFEVDTTQPGYRKIQLFEDGRFRTKVFRLPEGSWMPDLSQPGY